MNGQKGLDISVKFSILWAFLEEIVESSMYL